ncbi:MAG: ATP phosphoribosyltransferase [Myxococcaceae bacterium]
MLRIALPNKGRLSDDVRELFEDAGYDVRFRGDRALSASLGDDLEALFVRAQDIPEFVADGAADAGITGFDLVNESGRRVDELLDLGFGRCRLVVALPEDGPRTLDALRPGTRIATSFVNTARRFFADRNLAVEVVPVTGAAEIAPKLGVADAVVDLTSTGSTLRMNGLVEVATVLTSTARLIARPDASPSARRGLDELAMSLGSVLRARGQRYLMANAPREELPQIRKILPGLNGPTVTDVMDGGRFVAVHAVVPAKLVRRVTTELKAVGCEGILVTRIERIIP